MKKVTKKVNKFLEWIGKHWIAIVIGAAGAYIAVIIFKMFKDDGLDKNGDPYYTDFEAPEEKEKEEKNASE